MCSHSNRAMTDSISRSPRQDSRSLSAYDKLQEGGSPSHHRRSTRPSKSSAMNQEKTDNHASREDEEELVLLDTPLGSVKNFSSLMKATRNKNLALVRALLYMGDSVDFSNIDGWTALHMAAVYGAVDVAVVLLNAGADIEAKCKSGRTPLFLACREKQFALAKMLVERGADTSTADNSDWTLLFQAASAGSLEIVKWLFEKLDCNTCERVISKQPEKLLRELAGKGCKEVEKYLKDSGNKRLNPVSCFISVITISMQTTHTSFYFRSSPHVDRYARVKHKVL
ncbi:ankyrin repeat domain-containing protein 27-like [Portunus trituberculatus]|uniref:ankyrin repeat domain-containing protein 27-like n=1 Tax=Portunus trituberculatus TaxID=210409 RepID=UPI001E1CB937|nr:ankyrin repeat domain-containing protein 27-like [Portunus trituberculatus]